MTLTKGSRLFHIYIHTLIKEEIPEEFHYWHNQRVMPIFIVTEEGWTSTKNNLKIDSGDNHSLRGRRKKQRGRGEGERKKGRERLL